MERELFNEEEIPYICTPLTGKTTNEIILEVKNIVSKKPNMLEWRVDFFSDINNTDRVLRTLQEIDTHSNGLPLLFTIRAQKEGGQEIPLNDNQVVELLSEVCKSKFVNLIDFEVSNNLEHIKHLREVSKKYSKKLVLSYHNFENTPTKTEIIKHLSKMAFHNADIAKVAYMPKNHEDVMNLLNATRDAKEILDIPLITISMGDIGVMSRVLGWVYGSVLTFAVGEKSSAPGQISIESLQEMIRMLKKKQKM
ncbi:type I 3-dehydroquinate dehydratase [Bacillaceae bacterium IKA-2]|nr:type I 3-dehydroquinate dehydratase [Bacillaceae bacterium IKA-2]